MKLFDNGPLLVILLVAAIVIFGSKRLPDAARGLGRSLRIFRAETKGLLSDENAPPAQVTPPAAVQPVAPATPFQAPAATAPAAPAYPGPVEQSAPVAPAPVVQAAPEGDQRQA